MSHPPARSRCQVTGRVIDQHGAPVKFATVTALRLHLLGLGQAGPTGGATTQADGSFCLAGLPPAEYFLHASARSRPLSASPACLDCCSASREFLPGEY
ncbi:carboxypeptidase-like regulatory domain-containing protein, partial [Paludibaculum fermentans]|uniref:carboxypeptidase-like regulatory domain-containing protein n=1 Tax=Paludibaculum fermentans TaxID=1473598 RepID=UPI003EB78406